MIKCENSEGSYTAVKRIISAFYNSFNVTYKVDSRNLLKSFTKKDFSPRKFQDNFSRGFLD